MNQQPQSLGVRLLNQGFLELECWRLQARGAVEKSIPVHSPFQHPLSAAVTQEARRHKGLASIPKSLHLGCYFLERAQGGLLFIVSLLPWQERC